MARKQQQYNKSPRKMTRNKAITLGAIGVVVSLLGYYGFNSAIPANGTSPVFGFANNHFIKATHSARTGYHYVSQSSGSVKGLRSSGGGSSINPTYMFNKGELESIHIISDDLETHSKHNFNIDEFNVHTKDLGNFETETVTFVADKTGTFEYYCSIHPEMRGEITIE